MVFFFILSWFSDPGFLPVNHNRQKAVKFLSKYDAKKICPDCLIFKPQRSRHCSVCNRCVKIFDHHCPFIFNCVGAGNLKFFIPFLVLILLSTLILEVQNIFGTPPCLPPSYHNLPSPWWSLGPPPDRKTLLNLENSSQRLPGHCLRRPRSPMLRDVETGHHPAVQHPAGPIYLRKVWFR